MTEETKSAFRHFNKLPLELRLKIWAYVLPDSKIVDIVAISTDESQQLFFLPPEDGGDGRRQPRAKWVRTFVDHVHVHDQSLPSLLHVNRQTRDLVLKKWRTLHRLDYKREGGMISSQGGATGTGEERRDGKWLGFKPPEVQNDGLESMFYLAPPLRHNLGLFNPELDILFLADPPSTHHLPTYLVSSLSVLVRWLDQSVIESVTGLAIPYYTWRKDRTFKQLGLLFKFKRLQRLWVCFVGDREEGRVGWLGAVGRDVDAGEDGYLADVKEQVRCDVEELGRKEAGWRRPLVGVVRNRGAVVDELMDDVGIRMDD
jgi:hypothetical protein